MQVPGENAFGGGEHVVGGERGYQPKAGNQFFITRRFRSFIRRVDDPELE